MKPNKRQGIADYAILLIFSSVVVITAISLTNDRTLLKILLSVFALGYTGWGIWHHRKENSLHREVLLEYLLLSVLGLCLVFGLL